jgi:hypothetical protein
MAGTGSDSNVVAETWQPCQGACMHVELINMDMATL